MQGGVSTLAPNQTPRAAPVGHRPPPPASTTSPADLLRQDFDPRLPSALPPGSSSSSSPYPPTFGHTPSPHGSTPASNSSSVGGAPAAPLVGLPPAPGAAPAPGGAPTLPPSGAPPAAALPSAPMVSFIHPTCPTSQLVGFFLHNIPISQFYSPEQLC